MTGLNAKTMGHVSSQLFDHASVKSLGFVLMYIFAYLFKTQENFISIVLPILLLVTIDTATGVAFGIKQKNLSTKAFSELGVKLFAYSVYMCTARIIDAESGALSIAGISLPPVMTMVFKSYILGTEALSIFENLGKLGFPIPDRIKKYFNDFTDDGKLKVDNNIDSVESK